MTTSTGFDFSKNRHQGKFDCTFLPPEKSYRLSLLKEVKQSSDRKMIKRLIFDNLFP